MNTDTNKVDGNVLQAAVVETVETKVVVVDPKAWSWYNNPVALGGARPRSFITIPLAYDISNVLGRPLSKEDLDKLVAKDGPEIVCDCCGKTFQPVKFVSVNRRLEKALRRKGIDFAEGDVDWSGSFLVKGVVSLACCGGFYFYDAKSGKENAGAEFYTVNQRSCLGAAYLSDANRDQKGICRVSRTSDGANGVIRYLKDQRKEREQAERDRRESVTRGVADAFKKASQMRR